MLPITRLAHAGCEVERLATKRALRHVTEPGWLCAAESVDSASGRESGAPPSRRASHAWRAGQGSAGLLHTTTPFPASPLIMVSASRHLLRTTLPQHC
jgi:hypothetical protein